MYDSRALHIRSFHAGDVIRDVQVTEYRRIWVCYGRHGTLDDSEFGGSGLVCMDDRGLCIFDYATVVGGQVPPVRRSYALNVYSNREVWLCYGEYFPLVRLVNGKPEGVWTKQPIINSPAFAIFGGLALFASGYSISDEMFLVTLLNMNTETIVPVDDRGDHIHIREAYGRKDRLFLQNEEALFTVSVDDVEPW